LQPLDVDVCRPSKIFSNVALDKWLVHHSSQTYSICNTTGCVNAVHQKTVAPENNVAAFQIIEIFPYDKDIFTEANFLCGFVTDRPSKMLQDQV
jgi:hypothetical protein